MLPFALFVQTLQKGSRRPPRALRTRRSLRPATSETWFPATKAWPFLAMCTVRSCFFVFLQFGGVLVDRLAADFLINIRFAVAEQILYVNHLHKHHDHSQQRCCQNQPK